MDALSVADEPPVGLFLGRGVDESWELGQRDEDRSAVAKLHDECVPGDPYEGDLKHLPQAAMTGPVTLRIWARGHRWRDSSRLMAQYEWTRPRTGSDTG